MLHIRQIVAFTFFLASLAICCTQAAGQPPGRTQQPQEVPWPTRLGIVSHQIDMSIPVVDRVVLVPDTATFLDELGKWSPQGRWPVLIEDNNLAPLFVRGFKPAKIIRRESIGDLPADTERLQGRITNLLQGSWGIEATRSTVAEALRDQNFTPLGAVIASLDDPAWPAAVALAAGRLQPIIWLDGDWGSPGGVLSEARMEEIASTIHREFDRLGFEYESLGSGLDTITICRSMSGRAHHQLQGERQRLATTDLLGRDENGQRWACVGWIFGDEVRSAYVAMSSLFLTRGRVDMFNGYSTTADGFAAFNVAPAASGLRQRGYDVTAVNPPNTRADDWLVRLAGGLNTDLFMVNTMGMADHFQLHNSTTCYAPDVPVFSTPAAVYFVHSWSMQNPEDEHTIAGRFLNRGAYAYIGSMEEPFLQAFVTPVELSRRISGYVPLLVAARQWPQHPWRLNTFGDPLMVVLPESQTKRERLPDFPQELSRNGPVGEQDLNARLRSLLTAFRDASELADGEDVDRAEILAEAIELAVLTGRDDIAAQIWHLAGQHGMEERIASDALGPLFRRRDHREFLACWELVLSTDATHQDMLWHLFTPRLGSMDRDRLLIMQHSVREPMAWVDLRRLAPHIRRRFDAGHFERLVQRHLDRAERRKDREELQKLLRE